MQLSDVNLLDLDLFERGTPHEMFEVLRREAPVFRHTGDGHQVSDFWCITKHADLKAISKDPLTFSSERQGTLLRDPEPSSLDQLRLIMLNMDPPRHRQYRAIVNKAFTPRMVRELSARVKGMVQRIIDRVIERGECDFVEDLAAPLPMEVICEMMGVPEEDRRRIYELGNSMVGFDDPELQPDGTPGQINESNAASAEMFLYAAKLAEKARKYPGNDLATALLRAEVDGEKLTDMEFNSFFLILAIAGNETTRTVTTNGMYDLLTHPDQYRRLQEDRSLIPSAVEEILRFNPAVHSFRRTATRDVVIRDIEIRENDKIVLWYPSVNRDEEVFEDPNTFDITRSPNEHLSFGVGEHFCLGSNLARMELRVIFDSLVRQLPGLELAAPPRRLRSNFINGVKEMQVRFEPGHASSH
ncbi:cytochrome P450 [Myxococcota bacterium]|nr:cytochrome P450 [Myxococcota bacterium]